MSGSIDLTTDAREALIAYLRQINVSAQHLQTSTALELLLLKFLRRFASYRRLFDGAHSEALVTETANIHDVELLEVKSFQRKGNIPGGGNIIPAEQVQLLIDGYQAIERAVESNNVGEGKVACGTFQGSIESLLVGCRRITADEVLAIYTLTHRFAEAEQSDGR